MSRGFGDDLERSLEFQMSPSGSPISVSTLTWRPRWPGVVPDLESTGQAADVRREEDVRAEMCIKSLTSLIGQLLRLEPSHWSTISVMAISHWSRTASSLLICPSHSCGMSALVRSASLHLLSSSLQDLTRHFLCCHRASLHQHQGPPTTPCQED